MIILSSYSMYSIPVREQVLAAGINISGKMLIIPLASSFGTDFAVREKNSAVLSGFRDENVDIYDESDPDMCERLLKNSYDIINVPGGNTFRLLYKVKKYRLDSFIKEQTANGAVYFGSSAGAYLACPDIEYVKNFDDNNDITDNDFTALGLTDKYVLCHYDQRGINEIKLCRSFIGTDPELITINDSQIVII
ncbi:MAG: Type 1 glutamine amidotransferase-like domain-containing protein [Ruminococcus sp.]|nr:Type 1 glutamine amidotransferase-like domain-containing protein [Ruminococcus sp.]